MYFQKRNVFWMIQLHWNLSEINNIALAEWLTGDIDSMEQNGGKIMLEMRHMTERQEAAKMINHESQSNDI